MKNLISKLTHRTNPLYRDQRGITGLETAIVLIAFVVVSSVFAFAALSTGLFTTDKAKETIKAGLSEARGTMELKGSVLAAAAGEAIDMTAGNTIIKYTDNNQTKNLDTSSLFTATEVGSGDGDSLLERGEVFEVIILDMVGLLDTDLGTDTTFTLEVVPPKGAVLFIQRNTPVSFETINSLD